MPQLPGLNMDNVDRLAFRSCEVHKESLATFKHFNDNPCVSGAQIMVWKVNKK